MQLKFTDDVTEYGQNIDYVYHEMNLIKFH